MGPTRRGSSVPGRRHTDANEDAAVLASMGHKQELKRNFNTISMLGLAFAILNTWTALSASVSCRFCKQSAIAGGVAECILRWPESNMSL